MKSKKRKQKSKNQKGWKIMQATLRSARPRPGKPFNPMPMIGLVLIIIAAAVGGMMLAANAPAPKMLSPGNNTTLTVAGVEFLLGWSGANNCNAVIMKGMEIKRHEFHKPCAEVTAEEFLTAFKKFLGDTFDEFSQKFTEIIGSP